MHLAEAKLQCERLLVGLHVNPKTDRNEKNAPIETMYERFVKLNAVKYVAEIIPYESEEDLKNLLWHLHGRYGDDVTRFLDEEYRLKGYMHNEVPIPVKFTQRKHEYSTTHLKERVKGTYL